MRNLILIGILVAYLVNTGAIEWPLNFDQLERDIMVYVNKFAVMIKNVASQFIASFK